MDINRIVMKHLEGLGYACSAVLTGIEGERLAQSESFDLYILDLMLPDLAGERLVASVRSHDAYAPIIITSARDTVTDKVDLLELGANDYLVKPYDLDELAARVSAHLRMCKSFDSNQTITYRDWVIDYRTSSLFVGNTPVRLTRTEFSIIALLASNPRKAFSKQEVFESVQNEPYEMDNNTLNVHLSNIRSKLRASGTDTYWISCRSVSSTCSPRWCSPTRFSCR